MEKTPRSIRLQIGIFGRTNVGKSTFLNLITGQSAAITSPVPGTTTDVVEKNMELLPLGPVVFHDTAGIDDNSGLADLRIGKTEGVFDRADIVALVVEADTWGPYEEKICREAEKRGLPVVVVVNKTDLKMPGDPFLEKLKGLRLPYVACSSTDASNREKALTCFKQLLIENSPEDFLKQPPLVGDLIPPGGLAVMVVPIDLQAPKGRLILPQVQTIRDALDSDAMVVVVKEREYPHFLSRLKQPPDLVVCDSQVVMKMVADTPAGVPCTTFSILFSRLKGDIRLMSRGAAAIDSLQPGQKVLIAEACTHHATSDDIGRVKIPRWMRQYTGIDIETDLFSGRDYPKDLDDYSLVIHCGSCMHNRRETLSRINRAKMAGIPITNYGIAISMMQGVLKRVLTPFPSALDAYMEEIFASGGPAGGQTFKKFDK